VLLALASVPSACGPDLVFDNPCDKASPSYDACLCLDCPAHSQCVADTDESVFGATCACGNPGGWCIDRELCCPTGQTCRKAVDGTSPNSCCTPECTDKQCGDDGCGGSCGTCDEAFNFTCVDGLCVVKK